MIKISRHWLFSHLSSPYRVSESRRNIDGIVSNGSMNAMVRFGFRARFPRRCNDRSGAHLYIPRFFDGLVVVQPSDDRER